MNGTEIAVISDSRVTSPSRIGLHIYGITLLDNIAVYEIGDGPSAPTGDFSWSPQSPVEGEVVNFTDTSAGSPISWFWNFDDGSTSNLQNPSHVFHAAGAFQVRLTVSNPQGSDSAVKTVTIDPGDTIQHVALGDSYASGEGAGDYFPYTDRPDINECHRSRLAWSGLNPGGAPEARVLPSFEHHFFACSGAKTENLHSGWRVGGKSPSWTILPCPFLQR